MSLNTKVQETFLFLNKFVQSPKEVGSITPSSRFLAKAMTRSIDWDEVGSVAELGAGTGALTKVLIQRIRSDVKTLLFEKDPLLRSQLSEQFPGCTCYADACNLTGAMRREGISALDVIISGLPFFNFSQSQRDRLMEQIVMSLKPGGTFIAFQYSLQMKSQFNRYFKSVDTRFVALNFPPAFVYLCRKKGE